ncbi:MAG: alcohol dehydrogenase catalytic domain-containing protein [Methylobacterium sp.]|nr:alcohol dehydrogenase catalytic domain-containing protein [Methylobacterium sp.]MCA3615112.1 alcohol dehydrogenase catalytic domain-containing protein [Methylobacterium sp.]MCA3626776.1 alcohol dehydrogenase catalytic domain-containing protein [Methylobacterium sp.]MCA3641913.1 alcohol dehydrogenase catalytic domain-containing protein [Methylobacterium sp.]
MKALVYDGPNSLAYRDEPNPSPEADDLIVRVHAVGICGSDMHAYHGHDNRRPAPLILGHEAAGTIEGGPRHGERVTINPLVVDPVCPYAMEGRWHLSPTRQILSMPPRQGAFAEYVRIPPRNLVRIPDHLPFEQAALAEPIAVSWHAARIGSGKLHQPLAACRVVVIGGGAIGLTSAIVARLFGAGDIAIGETNPLRRETLRRTEGFEAYAPGENDPKENSVDLVIDAVGAVGTRIAASRMIRPGGVIVHLGLLPGLEGLDIRKLTLQEVTVSGSYCYTPHDFEHTVEALARRRLGRLQWFEERPLSEGARAFHDIDAGATPAAKIVLRV